MSRLFKNIKGTFDILPIVNESEGTSIPPSATWVHVEQTIREVAARFDMHEIRTPILEPTELIARGIGELTDLVSKEMFAFKRGKTDYVLRPEVTAPVMRAYLQHHLGQTGGVQRLFYIGPCFRAERPQMGRYRQFHQFGIELIGTPDPVADAETIVAMMAIYEALGVTETVLRLNTLGDQDSRPEYRKALKSYLAPFQDRLTETSKQRLETNPLRILDTKEPAERDLLQKAPRLIDFVGDESREHYEEVKRLLTRAGVDFVEDTLLVRGLDYYTRTAFELESPALGAQSALAGGGRYDLLASEIGSKSAVPAVGFAAGIERLLVAIEHATDAEPPVSAPLDIFIVAVGADAVRYAFELAQRLRKGGASVAYDMLGRSMKAQMREANRTGAPIAIILGKEEIENRVASVKTMSTGEQTRVELGKIDKFIAHRLS